MNLPKKEKKESFSSPKGMHDIIGEEYYGYQGLFEKAQEVAIYYGFKPIATPILEKIDVFTASVGVDTDIIDKEMYTLKTKGGDHLAMRPEGTAGIMRSYIEQGMQSLPQPVMLYYCGPFFRHEKPQRGRFREFYQFGLEILGAEKSIADAIIIRTTMTILDDAGFDNLTVEINSIGDKECRPAFLRELVNYYKKHANHICANCKERLKNNPMRLLDCKNPKCAEFKESAPDSVSYLCSGCKEHFKEVLEYLEEMGMPYRINKNLVRGLNYYTRTVFEIMEVLAEKKESEPVTGEMIDGEMPAPKEEISEVPLAIASGGRYDYLARSLGSKKDVPSVGVAFGLERVLMSPRHKKLTPRILKKPKVYFIQLGFEAKLKSLSIIEILRKARIPIMQSLSKDSITIQLGTAETLAIPYVIIFGQKEAMEGTVLVRKMETRSQESIKIENLTEYLKELK